MILEWLRLAPLLLFAAEHRGFKARSMEWASAPETRISVRDRKSTRLNSSHSQISYAVFCLKKKKKPQDETSLMCAYSARSLRQLPVGPPDGTCLFTAPRDCPPSVMPLHPALCRRHRV